LGGERDPELDEFDKAREQPIPFVPETVALELTPGKADLIEWTGTSLIRRDGVSGKPIWDAAQPDKPWEPDREPVASIRRLSYYGDERHPGTLVERAPDLNGDGTGDLGWAIHGTPSFVAVSGKDGGVLWTYSAKLHAQGGPVAGGQAESRSGGTTPELAHLLTDPVLSDVDRDGVVDVIAGFAIFDNPWLMMTRSSDKTGRGIVRVSGASMPHTPVVVAVSGRAGRWLWNYAAHSQDRRQFRNLHNKLSVLTGQTGSLVGFHHEARRIVLDLATGRPRGRPIELGFVPQNGIQNADLDSDGQPDVLALCPDSSGGPSLTAFSSQSGELLWRKAVARADYSSDSIGPPDSPLLTDFDGDGRPEVVIPGHGPTSTKTDCIDIRAIDGATGQARWTHTLAADPKQGNGSYHFLECADLDGDGSRDLIAVSRLWRAAGPATSLGKPAEPRPVYVDALSGMDGHPLWWWSTNVLAHHYANLRPFRWWGSGPDGRPLLAVGVGGLPIEPIELAHQRFRLHPPSVHLLDVGSGREVGAISGLTNARAADLDGDGLTDLWGDVDGQLGAFRGEAPEAWRALGLFGPANMVIGPATQIGQPAADFDRDGIPDTFITGLKAPPTNIGESTGSRTAITRSGRDGRVIWKTGLRSGQGWMAREEGESYFPATYPLPRGDLDGDGTPDVIVREALAERPYQIRTGAAMLPIQALSGRTGRLLWPSGALPSGFKAPGYSNILWVDLRVIEPNSTPDVLVRHGEPLAGPYASLLPADADRKPHLARVSGRGDRVIWDIRLVDSPPGNWVDSTPPAFHDVDRDGVLDAVLLIPPSLERAWGDCVLAAISLGSGKMIWSWPIRRGGPLVPRHGEIAVGDLDGDRRPEVLSMEETYDQADYVLVVIAFDGRDGARRWSWRDRAGFARGGPPSMMTLADFDEDGTRDVCVIFTEIAGMRRLLVLAANGQEKQHRDLPADTSRILRAADLDGDGRDELFVWFDERLRVLGSDLKERWSWPDPEGKVEQLFPATSVKPATVVMASAVGLDGAAGRPRWAGESPLKPPAFRPVLLDPGDGERRPLVISQGHGATVCRVVLSIAKGGRYETLVRGSAAPARARADPRWTRRLPWTTGIVGLVDTLGLVVAGALALVNLVIPVSEFRLGECRRAWTVRHLMALPVVVALPLTTFIALDPLAPALPDPFPAIAEVLAFMGTVAGVAVPPCTRLFVIGTLAGIPVIAFAALLGWTIIRWQWRRLSAQFLLTVLTAIAIGALWLWYDRRAMQSFEHYSWSGWYQPALLGMYAVGAMVAAVWAGRGVFEYLTRSSVRERRRTG
jgi:hypothetical protein